LKKFPNLEKKDGFFSAEAAATKSHPYLITETGTPKTKLFGFLMQGMGFAEAAIFLKLDSARGSFFVLGGHIIASFAFRTGQSYCDSGISHCRHLLMTN